MRSKNFLNRAGRRLLPAILLCSVMPALLACGRLKAVIVEPGTVFKSREPVKRLKVWAPNAKGEIVEAWADVPEGTSMMVPAKNVTTEK